MDKEGEDIFNQAVLANGIAAMRQNLSVYIEQVQIYAKIRRAKFDSLVQEGFSEAQALHIITNTDLFG